MESSRNRVMLAIQVKEAQKAYLAQVALVERLRDSGCSERMVALEQEEAERLQSIWAQFSEALAAIS